ncbi:MAG: hypothetical protein R3C01_05265 [Planctomycetaceae bacterium]
MLTEENDVSEGGSWWADSMKSLLETSHLAAREFSRVALIPAVSQRASSKPIEAVVAGLRQRIGGVSTVDKQGVEPLAGTLQQRLPQSSDSIPTYDPSRADEVSRRQGLLVEFLRLKGVSGLLLQRPENIAWLSCGAEVQHPGRSEAVASVFCERRCRVLLCNNIDSPVV